MSIGLSAAVAGTAVSLAGGAVSAAGQAAGGYAQLSASQKAIQDQINERAKAINTAQEVSRMSAGEASSINRMLTDKESALTSSMQSIQKQQAILDAIDPSVKAAGKNLVDLLEGKAADTLKPLQDQINRQRTNLTNQLAAQMGPGFMTSSAGIEALTKFDQNAAVTISQAQQSAISNITNTYGSLFGQQQQGQNAITSQTQGAFGQQLSADQAIFSANNNIQNRETGATLSAMSSNPIGFTGSTPYAGAPFTGVNSFGNTLSQFGAGISGTAGYALGTQAGQSATANLPGGPNAPTSQNFGQTLTQTPGFAIGKAS